MNTKSIKIHLVGSKYTNTKNFKFEKVKKKFGQKPKKNKFHCIIQVITLLDALHFSLSVFIISFLGKF